MRIVRLLFCSTIVALGMSLPPPAAIAQPGCDVGALLPQFIAIDRRIIGQGGRGPACPTSRTLKVALKRDISWWPDKTLTSTSASVRNGDLIVRYACSGSGSQRVYVEANDGNKKRQSGRLTVAYCG